IIACPHSPPSNASVSEKDPWMLSGRRKQHVRVECIVCIDDSGGFGIHKGFS
uniref:Zf-RVT domain-containing protein n=1 Tax=Haemonchus contortus TaxID=6289 RepID=A0A7I4YWC8_HAECO